MKRTLIRSILAMLLVLPGGAGTFAADEPPALTMGTPVRQSVAGWHEIGRTSARLEDGRWVTVGSLETTGDRLVSLGTICDPQGWPCSDVAWSSDDGTTWTAHEFPGSGPNIADLAATPTGFVAIGTDKIDGKRAAAMWTSADGVEWTPATPPPARKAGRIISAADPLVVQADERLWTTGDGQAWRKLGRAPAGRPEYGPGGFLSWGGGGQDLVFPTELWHSPDGRDWTKLTLPKGLRGGHPAFGAIQVLSLGDRWVLVPNERAPGWMYTSTDGQRWHKVPRPSGMHGDYIWWMEPVGDQIQASGTLYGPNVPTREAIWTWEPGKYSGPSRRPRGHTNQGIGAPAPWADGYLALGMDERCRFESVTLWSREPSSGATATDPGIGAPAPPECWSSGRVMHDSRARHTSTLLADGRVLMVGGAGSSGSSGLDMTEAYDPAIGAFKLTGYLSEGRDHASATRLADGRVLIAGGRDRDGLLRSAEIFDPTTELFAATGERTRAGVPDDAVLLADGRVLLVQGKHVEVYDPTVGEFSAVGMMAAVRDGAQLAPLPDGRVLIVGDDGRGQRAGAEVFDPGTMSSHPVGLDRDLGDGYTLTALADGRALLAGGTGEPRTAHVFDPATGSFAAVGPLAEPRSHHAAELLPDGRVLLIGGLGGRTSSRTLETFDPATGSSESAGRMLRPRVWAGSSVLGDGRVLISGGRHGKGGNVEATAELFDPGTGKSGWVKPVPVAPEGEEAEP